MRGCTASVARCLLAEGARLVVPALPPQLALGVGAAFSLLPNPWLSAEGMKRLSYDNVLPAGAVDGFAELGIDDISSMEDIAERYLVRFRKSSMFIDDESEVVKQPR